MVLALILHILDITHSIGKPLQKAPLVDHGLLDGEFWIPRADCGHWNHTSGSAAESVHPGINDMKRLRLSVSVMAAASALVVNSGNIQAQIASQENPARQRNGEVLRTQTQEGSLSGPKANRPELPESMSQVIRERLLQFEEKREEYLAQQLELMHRLHRASDSDRAQLREQLREQRQAWLEEAKKIREQARARVQEMKRELVNHSEVIEAAREQVREQVQEQLREKVRERRGTD